MVLLVAESSAPPFLPPEPPDPDLHVVCPIDPPEPPVPPDPPPCLMNFLKQPSNLRIMAFPFYFLLQWKLWLSPRPSPQALSQISILKLPSRMATKNGGGGGGGIHVSASDTSLAYGLYSPVIYRFGSLAYGLYSLVIYMFGFVECPSISSCFDLPIINIFKVLHVHVSSLVSTYFATVEWFRQLFVWVMLELRFMILAGDIPMGLASFGTTFAISSSIYIALARSSAVCSFLTGFLLDVGVVFVYLSSWWQVEEKLIIIFIPMNMDMGGHDFRLIPRLNQSSLLIFPPIWSDLDEQASLVLQESSSLRMFFSAYGAVCVVLRVTLDAIFKEAFEIVVIQFHMVPFCDLHRHPILYVVVVYLAGKSLFVFSFAGV